MSAENKFRFAPRYIGACMVFLLLVPICALLRAQTRPSPASPWKGREVFREKGCIQCHAVYDEGGKGGPDLGKRKFYGTYLELAASMWNHFPGMSQRMQKTGYHTAELDEQEMSQLVSYLAYIRYLGEPGNIVRGKRLLETKGCMSCHKFSGVGGDIGPDFSTIKEYMAPLMLVEAMWNHGPNMMKLFQEHHIKRPELTGNEIIDLAVAIRSYMSPTKVPVGAFALGDPANGKKLAEQKGCMRCHAFRGVGGKVGPDFDDIDLNYSVTQIAGQMWNHGPQMWQVMQSEGIAFPVFKKGEMADVIAYIYGLKLEDAPGNVEQGFKIVNAKGCLSCHSLQGKGADIAAELATLGELDAPLKMATAMWNHAPAMQEKLQEKELQWPELNGKDMANLYAYLRSLAPKTQAPK